MEKYNIYNINYNNNNNNKFYKKNNNINNKTYNFMFFKYYKILYKIKVFFFFILTIPLIITFSSMF